MDNTFTAIDNTRIALDDISRSGQGLEHRISMNRDAFPSTNNSSIRLYSGAHPRCQHLYCLGICGLGHFAVDFGCAFTVLALHAHGAVAEQWYFTMVVAYNLLAFGSQALVGSLVDRWMGFAEGVGLGLALTAFGVALAVSRPFTALAFLGCGNAIFHVSAGAVVYRAKPGQASGPGMFVAPGGVGLVTGIVLGRQGAFSPLWIAPVLCILAVCSYRLLYINKYSFMGASFDKKLKREREAQVTLIPSQTAVLALLLLVVALRSFAGFALPAPWKAGQGLGVLAAAAFAGKASGGFLADRFGWQPVCTSVLTAAALLSLVHDISLPAACGALFCLQATTGVTLAGVQAIFPQRSAFAFGLPCLALLLGALPFYLPEPMGSIPPVLLVGAGLVAALSAWAALTSAPKGDLTCTGDAPSVLR